MDRLKPLIALGVLLGAIESLWIPPMLPFRIGLANIATLLAIVIYGVRAGFIVAACRIILVAAATGSWGTPFLFSAAAAATSTGVMSVIAALPVSLPAVSAAGGFAAGIAQIGVFMLLAGLSPTEARDLVPIYAGWGLFTGAIVGGLAQYLSCDADISPPKIRPAPSPSHQP